VSDDLVQVGVFRRPSPRVADGGAGSDEDGRIAGTPRSIVRGNRLPSDAADGIQNFSNGEALAVAQVVLSRLAVGPKVPDRKEVC
jgi:hypothetical protein